MHKDFIELTKRISNLADDELKRANEEYGLFHSLHEGYAILQEEIEESAEYHQRAMDYTERMWRAIKANDKEESIEMARSIYHNFKFSAAGIIQCVAMAKKIVESEKVKDKKDSCTKSKFRIEDYKGKYVMRCDTEEKAEVFCKYLNDIGMEWCYGVSYLKGTNWHVYKKITCYSFNEGEYSSFDFYKNEGYTILEFDDFDWSSVDE